MRAHVLRLPMAHPGDLSALDRALAENAVRADEIAAVIGKIEGNGGVNDFTRGYFTQSLMGLLSCKLGQPADELLRRIPCVLSGGTEGVLSPHYVVLSGAGIVIAGQSVGPRGHAVFTPFANALGLPAISVPCGSRPYGVPIGFQLCAAESGDRTLLSLADEYQRRTGIGFRWPPI